MEKSTQRSSQMDNKNNQPLPHRSLNLWAVYGICLLLSTIFFFLFGSNSPKLDFNVHVDYQWYKTMGNALLAGKIPYRDLFEQKGPITYFVTAFCCLFPDPDLVMLFIEIISMSLFLFFAYRICNKKLNALFSIIALIILILAVFTSELNTYSAAALEEFGLPICSYFLFCWLDFLQRQQWDWLRSLCLGLCFGIILWTKFTIMYFFLIPMIVWVIISLYRKQYRALLFNILYTLAGFLIITMPILIFYALHHAIDDLFYVYFFINLTSYGTLNWANTLNSFNLFFTTINPVILLLIIFGVIYFAVTNWRIHNGWLLLLAFLCNFLFLSFTIKHGLKYYYINLFPYAILGTSSILNIISSAFITRGYRKYGAIALMLIFIIIYAYFPTDLIHSHVWFQKEYNEPVRIAKVIHEYERTNNTKATLFCYRLPDLGIYTAAGIIPNNYFWVSNYFNRSQLPQMYEGIENTITQQTSDFIITDRSVWHNDDLLQKFYKPYEGDQPDSNNIKFSDNIPYYYFNGYELIILIKK